MPMLPRSAPQNRRGLSEVLDIIPAILRVLRTVRPKYGCRSCTDGVVQAKVLPRLIESGMASTALVSHVVVSKFAWYLPLYRQVQILAGQGVHLDRATLAGWVKLAAWWLRSLYEPPAAHDPGRAAPDRAGKEWGQQQALNRT